MSNETEQKPTPHRTRIEVSVEFDEIPGQPQRPPETVCCKELPVRSYEAALNSLPDPPRTIARNRWENKDTISRNSPIIAQMQQPLGWSDAYVDELFVAADTLAKS